MGDGLERVRRKRRRENLVIIDRNAGGKDDDRTRRGRGPRAYVNMCG